MPKLIGRAKAPNMITNPYLEPLRQKAEAVAAQIAGLQRELEEMEIAARVLTRLGPVEAAATPASAIKPGTVKAFIAEFLRGTDSAWALPTEVHVGASKLKGAEIPSGTIFPTLSEMVRDQIIVRRDGKIALKTRAGLDETNEAPEAEAKEAS